MQHNNRPYQKPQHFPMIISYTLVKAYHSSSLNIHSSTVTLLMVKIQQKVLTYYVTATALPFKRWGGVLNLHKNVNS